MKTTTSIVCVILLGLLLGGGQALAAGPPTLMVQVIGAGKVTGTGINCGLSKLTCGDTYSDTSAVDLTPTTTVAGWSFDHWEDDCSGSATPCSASPASTPTFVTAVFVHTAGSLDYHSFSVSTSADSTAPGGADGLVSNGSGSYPISCGDNSGTPATNCGQTVPTGSTMTVQEAPDAGYSFNGWGGSCSGTHPICSAYLNSDRSVSAEFFSGSTTLLTVMVSGSGTVTGGGLTCSSGATCTKQEPPTATITLTEEPADGYAFTGWSTGCSGTETTCTVEMSTAQTVTATFAQVVPILITVNGAGTVSGANVTCGPGPQTCSGTASPDTTIELTATPSVTGGSVSWVGCTTATGTECTIEVGSDPISISSTFSGGTTGGGGSFVTLSVSVTGDGYVYTTTTPTLWCTSAGGAGCTISVQQNTSVQLHANAASNAITDFNGWGGSCPSSLSTTCTLLMSGAKSASASFAGSSGTYTLAALVTGSGSVSGGGLKCSTSGGTGCTSPEATGAQLQLTASPNAGSTFSGWGGACSGTGTTCTVTMASAQNVTATFTASGGGGGGGASPTLALTVTGGGTVSAGTTKCASTGVKSKVCTTAVPSGSTVALKATPLKGYKFTGWKGACTGTKPTCSVVMSSDLSVTATFKVLPIAAGATKPKVAKLRTGFRVTFSFHLGEAGKVTVTSKPKTTKLVKTLKAGARTIRFTVKKHGRYTFTLSLRSKSGTHALHYKVKV